MKVLAVLCALAWAGLFILHLVDEREAPDAKGTIKQEACKAEGELA